MILKCIPNRSFPFEKLSVIPRHSWGRGRSAIYGPRDTHIQRHTHKECALSCIWSVKSKIFTLWTLTENICLTGATSSSDSRSSLASPCLQPHWTTCMLFSRRESVISCLCVWYSLWSVSQMSFTFSWLIPTYSLIFTSALSSSRKPSLNNCLRHTDQAEFNILSSVLHHCLCIPPILQLTSYYFSHIGHTFQLLCMPDNIWLGARLYNCNLVRYGYFCVALFWETFQLLERSLTLLALGFKFC